MMPFILMPFIRRLLCAEHRKQQTGLSVTHASEKQILMVKYARSGNKAVLRTVNELQAPGEMKYSIPYRLLCGFTLFQGWLTFIGYKNGLETVNFDQHLYPIDAVLDRTHN